MAVRITVDDIAASRAEADAVVIPYGKHLAQEIRDTLRTRDYKGDWGAAEVVVAPRGMKAQFVVVVGLGDASDYAKRAEGMRRALGKAMSVLKAQVLRELAVELHGQEDAVELAQASVEGLRMADYTFAEHKSLLQQQHRRRSLKQISLLVDDSQRREVTRAVRETRKIVDAMTLTRDLVNQPASHMSPQALVDAAKDVARGEGMRLKVLDRKTASRDGWRAFLAVADGSSTEPFVIHLTYNPVKSLRDHGVPIKRIVLVGKGITFDSGGLSLKPADKMEDMKIDMAGGAAVLGAMAALSQLQLDVEVHGIVAACENMPSGTAYRPGDVIESRSGKTIEILNTDAEGRVTLADALDYAIELKPDAVVDLATLTGASIVALGITHAALFSNDAGLNESLLRAAARVGEGLEDLPLPEEYKQYIDSKVADVRNSTSNHPSAGAITAALFLQEFVGKTAWAHLDIAGPAYVERAVLPYWTYGGTGYGVRTLVEFLRNFA